MKHILHYLHVPRVPGNIKIYIKKNRQTDKFIAPKLAIVAWKKERMHGSVAPLQTRK